VLVQAAQRRDKVLLRAATAPGVAAGHHVGLHPGHQHPDLRRGGLVQAPPAQCSTIELRSRSFVPAHVLPGNNDARSLGVCVGRLQVDGVDLSLEDDVTFADGWHPFESDSEGKHWRWSRDRAPLPAGSRLIVIDVVGRGYYWVRPSAVPRSDSVAASA